MAGLVPAISLRRALASLVGMPGTRPGMTNKFHFYKNNPLDNIPTVYNPSPAWLIEGVF
jgi:hypothetical protein